MAAELYIDGGQFEDIAGFYRQVTAQLARPGVAGGDNLDALCDLLRGGFGGAVNAPAVVRWQNFSRSRALLGEGFAASACRVLAGDAEEGFRTLILEE